MNPQLGVRAIDKARELLASYTKDVYLHKDNYKGDEAGKSPGYGLTIVTESTTGVLLSAETMSARGDVPEDVATTSVQLLLNEVLSVLWCCCINDRVDVLIRRIKV